MDENQFRIFMHVLERMHDKFERMADAAEAQVKETKAMRQMVEAQHDREIREAWNS